MENGNKSIVSPTFDKHVSGMTFTRYAQSQNIGKVNNLKVFGGYKQESQNQLWSPIPEGAEP
jgi:hypothetical protein